MKEILKEYEIKASISDVWACLTDVEKMEGWGSGPAEFSLQLGAEFKMWGDYMSGKVLRFEAEKYLEQEWIVDGMNEPSHVLFELSDLDGATTLKLTHTNVQDDMLEDLDDGWDRYYLGAIKEHLEN